MNLYSPDVYDRLASAFRSTGNYADARNVIREKLRVEREILGLSVSTLFLDLYAVLFDSGLTPLRAIVTFIGCILIGWAGAVVADHGIPRWRVAPVLVIETSSVNGVVVPSTEVAGEFTQSFTVAAGQTKVVQEVQCGDAIEPLLYALDIFVPALEIHQERRCAITTEAIGLPWRFARALYSILGWVVTALTVLTVSGVARRHLEA